MRSKKSDTVSVITVISIIAVALGVGALLAVMSITSGFREEFREKVLGVNAHAIVMKYGRDFTEYREVVGKAEAMAEVKHAAPFLFQDMMLTAGKRTQGVSVKGIDPERSPMVLDLPSQIRAGSLAGLRPGGSKAPSGSVKEDDEWGWLDEVKDPPLGSLSVDATVESMKKKAEAADSDSDSDSTIAVADVEDVLGDIDALDDDALPDDETDAAIFDHAEQSDSGRELPGIVIGWALAKTLDINVGQEVRLMSPLSGFDASLVGNAASRPSSLSFRVIGIFQAGFQEYDTQLVYIDLFEAQRLFGQGDVAYGVEMKVHDIDKSGFVAEALRKSLEGPYRIVDWEELNQPLFRALLIQQIALTLVISIIVFVAAFMVVATMIMMVLEKKKDISILKAMGATDRAILGMFAFQGIIIGAVGTLLGLALGGGAVLYLGAIGFPLDPKVYLIDHVPVVFRAFEFWMTALIALVICTTATLFPSVWAARLLPAEGLRRRG